MKKLDETPINSVLYINKAIDIRFFENLLKKELRNRKERAVSIARIGEQWQRKKNTEMKVSFS